MNFDISKKQDWKHRKATAAMLRLTRSQRRLVNLERQQDSSFNFCWCFLLAVVLFISGCLISRPAHAEEVIEGYSIDSWTEAIWEAEGGFDAVKPYGILSVPCDTKVECRLICENTVRNNYKRWKRAGKAGKFVNFLAKRYAPYEFKEWAQNVAWLLQEGI